MNDNDEQFANSPDDLYSDLYLAPDDVNRIAREFAEILTGWLTTDGDELSLVIARNRDEVRPNVCHSHDFCDANEAMAQAFETVMGYNAESDPDGVTYEHDCMLWSAAWAVAVAAEFYVDHVADYSEDGGDGRAIVDGEWVNLHDEV